MMCLQPIYLPEENHYEPCCECEVCIGTWVEDKGQKPTYTFEEAYVDHTAHLADDLPF